MQESKKVIIAFLGKPEDIQVAADLLVREVRETLTDYPEAPIVAITGNGFNAWIKVKNPNIKATVCCGHFAPKKNCSYVIFANGKNPEHNEVLKRFAQHKQMPAEIYNEKGALLE